MGGMVSELLGLSMGYGCHIGIKGTGWQATGDVMNEPLGSSMGCVLILILILVTSWTWLPL